MSNVITAMDVENQQFNRKMRGYDPDEVDLFLKSVAAEIERLNLSHGEMREQLGAARRELEELRTREQTLQKTLVSAQGMADDMKDKARREGDLVIQEARMKADQLLKDAQDRLLKLEADITRSKLERENFEHRLRGLIDQHQALLDMRRDSRRELDNLRVMTPDRVTDVG